MDAHGLEALPRTLAVRLQGIARRCERAGWQITNFEVDLVSRRVDIEIKRGADADRVIKMLGPIERVNFERFDISVCTELRGRRGDRSPVSVLRWNFMGRETGHLRDMLTCLSHYITDNQCPVLLEARRLREITVRR